MAENATCKKSPDTTTLSLARCYQQKKKNSQTRQLAATEVERWQKKRQMEILSLYYK